MKVLTRLLLVAVISLSLVPLALADSCSGFSSTLNISDSQGTGPFGDVCVTLSGQTATITFTADTGFAFIDSSIVDVNLNTSSFSTGSITESIFDHPAFTGAGNVNGFGVLNLTLKDKSASVHEGFVSFTVTNTDTLSPWTSASDVLALNSKGFDAAAHVFCITGACAGNTFFVGEGTGTPTVPEPASLALLGGGLLALGGLARQRMKRT